MAYGQYGLTPEEQQYLYYQQQQQQQQSPAMGVGNQAANVAGQIAGNKARSYLYDLAQGGQGAQAPNASPVISSPAPVSVGAPATLGAPASYASQASQSIAGGLEGAGIGSQTAGALGSTIGYGVPIAAGAYSAYNIGKNLVKGKKDPMGGALSGAGLGGSVAALAPFAAALGPLGVLALMGGGALLGAGLGQIGHSQNYYKGLDRAKSWENTYGNEGVQYSTGQSISPQEFRKNLELLNYDQSSATKDRDIGAANALSFLTTGQMGDQSAIAYANLAKQGVPVAEMFQKAGIGGYQDAFSKINQAQAEGKIDAQTGDILRNGLNVAFGEKGNRGGKAPTPTPAQTSPRAQLRVGRGLPPVPESSPPELIRPKLNQAMQDAVASMPQGSQLRGLMMPPVMEAKQPDQMISARLRLASKK